MPEQTAMSGKELARQRRAMMSRVGKQGSGGARTARPGPRPAAAVVAKPSQPEPRPAEPGASVPVPIPASVPETPTFADSALDEICEFVEANPDALGADGGSVRALCRQRRQALASVGKKALPSKGDAASAQRGRGKGVAGVGGVVLPAADASGRELARQRRVALSRSGRGDAEPARPSGRVRPQRGDAPPKVEVGTTLSGRIVTGTQVERKGRVSGNEAGSCRIVTGTEYIGSEQFSSFCEGRPQAGPAKVGESTTTSGQLVSGSEVGRSKKVTGDEAGTCTVVTGTEYLGRERFADFCATNGITPRPDKVAVGVTERKGMPVTGSDEARAGRVTGTEPGAARSITGSQYADAGAARFTINGPSKVALTHTVAGRPVSGTEVGRSIKVTGDEAGSCRQVSGTEYLSNEQFHSVCQTRPEPAPVKVGVDASRNGQRITGNLVDRSERVTGNEPGSCQRVTGSQYGSSRICGGGAEKVGESHTLSGSAVTGTEIGHRPQMTGDERGGCLPVTGNEYVAQEQYAAYCPPDTIAPQPPVKVGRSETPRGLPVSGTMMGRSGLVTGNEPGSGVAVSGTPYAGLEQTRAACGCGCGCCPAGAAPGGAVDPRPTATPPAPRMAIRPMVGPAAGRGVAPSFAEEPAPAATDFSIVSPSRQAQEFRSRITGSDNHGGGGRITGPINLATGLVSGTPEFRYRDDHGTVAEVAPQAEEAVAPARITGEGRDAGVRITGDDWARSGRVTGTEGQWAQGRNLTLRGEARGAAASAWANKGRERVEVPPARITGSAGNAGKGAVITVSGGARG